MNVEPSAGVKEGKRKIKETHPCQSTTAKWGTLLMKNKEHSGTLGRKAQNSKFKEGEEERTKKAWMLAINQGWRQPKSRGGVKK